MNGTGIYTFEDFAAEVARQHAKFRYSYVLRLVAGWPKIAFLTGRCKAGWYLVRGDSGTQRCHTIGPSNTKGQARHINSQYPDMYFDFGYVVLLWEEPPRNEDRGHRKYACPWYRVPPRGW